MRAGNSIGQTGAGGLGWKCVLMCALQSGFGILHDLVGAGDNNHVLGREETRDTSTREIGDSKLAVLGDGAHRRQEIVGAVTSATNFTLPGWVLLIDGLGSKVIPLGSILEIVDETDLFLIIVD